VGFVRLEAVRALRGFVPHAEFHAEIKVTIPNAIQLLADEMDPVQREVIKLVTSFVAHGEFYGGGKWAELKACQANFQHAVEIEFSNIIKLLTNRVPTTRNAALELIRNLANHIESISGFDTIAPVFLHWLHEHDSELQAFAVTAICTLITIGTTEISPIHLIDCLEADFRSKMAGATQLILSWLTFRNMKLRITALDTIRSLDSYRHRYFTILLDQYHPEIQSSSMQIVGLLGDQYSAVRMACVELLCSPKTYGGSRIIIPDSSDTGQRATANSLVPLAPDGSWPTLYGGANRQDLTYSVDFQNGACNYSACKILAITTVPFIPISNQFLHPQIVKRADGVYTHISAKLSSKATLIRPSV
ncbi:2524_t:CDS:2, partial [Acaulospora colombiana]